jgi:site-specific DNA-methyltransferase (adenine-specific)
MIIHGDSLKILPTLNESFDCCITDSPYSAAFVGKGYELLKRYQQEARLNKPREKNPWSWGGIPGCWSAQYYVYNKEYEDFTKNWMREIYRLLLPGSFFASFSCIKLLSHNAQLAQSVGFEIKDTLIWKFKSTFSKGLSLNRLTTHSEDNKFKTTIPTGYEPILLCQKPLEGNNKENWSKYHTGFIDTSVLSSNVLEVDKPSKEEKGENPHYSIKPERLLEILCKGLCAKRIIDPFMGSGSLAAACFWLGVDYTGIELELQFYDYAKGRLDDIQPNV